MPFATFKELGFAYYAARGQKGYNGVAILSKLPIKAEFSEDFANLGHARHIAVVLESGVTVHNFYVPAGGDEPDPNVNEKFSQKLSYLTCMEKYFNNLDLKKSILVGDLNIAPRPDDVWDHKKLSKVVSHTPIEIKHLKKVQNSGPWEDVVGRLFLMETFSLGGHIGQRIGVLQIKEGDLIMFGLLRYFKLCKCSDNCTRCERLGTAKRPCPNICCF